ncbi:RNA polymerase subunit sigma-70 [Actinophytocola glycyrrhizae]|uniref:RNA polymerase sigma factor n=1 Tax=Actinophytocola glycyrrhizae TaxID=2044873 RepID=A0ABV9RXK6_9PSEU
MVACLMCGRPLQVSAGRGRTSVYCSAACRQKAYRARRSTGTSGGTLDAVHRVIADMSLRMQLLAVDPERVSRPAAEPAVEKPQENASEGTFTDLVEPYRREIQAYCYRMLGSYDDAEDLVQDVFLRAWRGKDAFAGRASVRTWLYRIATNACMDFLRRNQREPQRYEPLPGFDSGAEEGPERVPWLQPYPDQLLDLDTAPDSAAVSRETLELVFLTAIQHLPPRQRAVLLLRDVLDWSAAATAEQLEITVATVNNDLQRARPVLRQHLPARRADWAVTTGPSAEEKALVERYMAAANSGDLDAMGELLTDGTVLTMPPNPLWFVGRDAILAFLRPSLLPDSPAYVGAWRSLATSANRQPAVAHYLQRPGTAVFRAQVLDVLRVEGGRIVQITAFEPHLFPAFGLPLKLPPLPLS